MVAHQDFEWDEKKATKNIVEHDLSFSDAVALFGDPDMVEVDTTRAQDQEQRSKAIGIIDGSLFTAVFTKRGHVTRLISARRANKKEERIYGNRSVPT